MEQKLFRDKVDNVCVGRETLYSHLSWMFSIIYSSQHFQIIFRFDRTELFLENFSTLEKCFKITFGKPNRIKNTSPPHLV